MSDEPVVQHMRPFFLGPDDFAAAVAPHFRFLVDDLGFTEPVVTEQPDEAYDVRYDGNATAVVLSWEIESGSFGCQLAPRAATGELDPDFEAWLTVNEVLAARGHPEHWVSQAELDDVDEEGFAAVMEREAENMRKYCADVLRGDWSVRDAASRWLKEGRNG